VADAAIDACREDESVACSRWGLRLGPEVGEQSFTDLFVECASGWASLAAGLLVASGGGRPNPKVWASGSWDWRDGIRRVDHLTEKIQLAAELGAERFFVPDSQIQEAEQVAQGIGLHIGRLVSAKRDPRAALDDYLWSLEAPPRLSSDPDNFDRCKAYYLRPRIESRRELDEYYQSQLLPRIVRNLRGQVQTEWPAWNPTRLVTIVSGSPDLVRMSALALGVRHCLLLHTTDADQSRLAHGLKLELERHGVRCLLGPFRVDEHIEQEMNRQLAPFLHGANPSEVVIDLTPGTKQMTVTLARLAIPGNWLVYLSHRFAVDRRAEPGSERFVRWAVGTG
jgi:hypothetical protein